MSPYFSDKLKVVSFFAIIMVIIFITKLLMGWLPQRSLFFVSLSAKQLWFFKGGEIVFVNVEVQIY